MKEEPHYLTRRRVVLGTAAVALTAGIGTHVGGRLDPETRSEASNMKTNNSPMPLAYVPHGGGPFSYVEMGLPVAEVESLAGYWRSLGQVSSQRPKALLVISAHWEARVPTVMTSTRPPMLFDYSGFPEASYKLDWPAPGDPTLAARVRTLLFDAGFDSAEDAQRGFDHGTFVPFGRSFPEATIPTIQLSLKAGLDPQEHLAMGRSLRQLRNEGVLILGSGMSYHNLRAFRSTGGDSVAEQFDAWLQETVSLPPTERDERLIGWAAAPGAREAHPREEHLLPLMVIAGAAGDDLGTVPWSNHVFGKRVSAVHFGTG